MSTKRVISSIVLVASAVLLAIGSGTTYAAPTAETPGPPDETGPTQPAGATVEGAAMQAPPLSGFVNIWVDEVGNYNPAVAYNSNHDEYLVVWENARGATWDIYARRVAGDGTLKSWFAIVSNVGKANHQPDVAYNPVQDEYLIVYTYHDSNNDDIRARLVKWNGADLGNPRYAEFSINEDSGTQWNPAVTYNSQNNEYLVVYENWWASGLRDIDARRVDKDGNPQGGSSGVNIATGPDQVRRLPDVAYNAARNEYLIAYTYQYSATNGDILCKVASADLGTLSSEILIIYNPLSDEEGVALAAGPDEYLVVWQDGRVSEDLVCICSRRVNGNGTPATSGIFDIACDSGQPHSQPAVAYGNVYGYLVAWRYASGGTTGNDVYGRFVKPGQNVPSGSRFAIDDGWDHQRAPALACGAHGDCLVVEEDNYPVAPPADYEIRGRFVLARHVYLPLVLR